LGGIGSGYDEALSIYVRGIPGGKQVWQI